MPDMDRVINASDKHAKAVLVLLCSNDSSLDRRASALLAQIEIMEQQHGVKRKAEFTLKVCIQCQEPFYEEDNNDKACQYHEGDLEVDYDGDVWADHDENCHGEIDTDEMREQFPEGFTWNCCEKPGHRTGCAQGRHEAINGQRGRYGKAPGTYLPGGEDSNSAGEGESEEDEDERAA